MPLSYFPTIALTNSLTFQHIEDAGRDFPLIRVFGTLGWIAIGLVVGAMAVEEIRDAVSPRKRRIGGDGIFQALFLPHTPPGAKKEPITVRRILGLDALVKLKDKVVFRFCDCLSARLHPVDFLFFIHQRLPE